MDDWGSARVSRAGLGVAPEPLVESFSLGNGFPARRRKRQPGLSRSPFHNLPHSMAFKKRLAKLAGSGSIRASVKKSNNMSAANIVCIVALSNLICWSAVAQNDAGGLSFYGPHAAENAAAARAQQQAAALSPSNRPLQCAPNSLQYCISNRRKRNGRQ